MSIQRPIPATTLRGARVLDPIRRPSRLVLLCLAGSCAIGCATVRPDPAFRSTRDMLAGRHPGEVVWVRDDAARAAVDARVAEALRAPLTMDTAAEVALLRNPSLQATLERLGIAQADLAQATRLENPGLSFTSQTGGGQRQRTVGVTGNVVDWLVRPLRRKLAAAELERTKLEVGHALLDVVAEARLALLRHQAAEQLAERLSRIEEIDRAAADYARALFEAGNMTALARANAEAGWAETRAALGRARLEVARTREDVIRALGLSGSESWSAQAELDAPSDDEPDAAELRQAASDHRLDLAAARWAVGALEHALRLKRGTRFFPVGVDLGVERERETDGVRLTGPTIELRLPLFDTGKASIARLEAELAQARWQHEALERRVHSEVREKAVDLDAARRLFRLYRDTIVPLRGEVLDRTLREYNQMLVGTFDVLLAKQQVVEAERRSIEALALYWEARIALDRATGGNLPGSLRPPDPDAEETPEHPHHSPGMATELDP